MFTMFLVEIHSFINSFIPIHFFFDVKKMVEAMGGQNSEHYDQFKSFCFSAYNILRNYANLILSLFWLMVNANIPQIDSQCTIKVYVYFSLVL
jgi:hypothetical protein